MKKDNLGRLMEARKGMTIDEAKAFTHYFVGALQSYVPEKDWDRCIQIAKECLGAK